MAANKNSRQSRLFKNSAYSLLSWLFPLIPTFVVTPIVVKALGNELYGIYTIFLGFISYFFTFGIGKAAAKYVAEYRATGEIEKISDIISSTVLLSFILGIGGTSLVCLFARPIVVDLLRISPPLQDTAVFALYLACANILLLMLMQIFQFVLQGLQRFDRYLLLMNLNSLLLSVGLVILSLRGFGLVAILIWTLIVAAIIGGLSLYMAVKLTPEFKFSFRVKSEAWRSVYRYAASIIAYQIFGNLLLMFERAWITRKFGPEALTYYAVPMTLGMYIHMFTSSLVVAIFPMVNELLAEKEKLVTLYKKSTKLILMLVVFAVVSAVVGGKIFLGLWMNDEFARISYILLVIHVLTFGLLAMNTIVWQIAESFRFAALNAFATLAWMAISMPLMVVLSEQYETVGVALARFAGVFIFVPLIFYVEKRFLGGIFWDFWGGLAVKIIFAASLTAGCEWLVLNYMRHAWAVFFSSIAVGFTAYCLALLASGFFDSEDQKMLKKLVFRTG